MTVPANTSRSIPPLVLKASLLIANGWPMTCSSGDSRTEHPWRAFGQVDVRQERARLLAHEVTGRFTGAVMSEARRQCLQSEEHFNVGGDLLEAWIFVESVQMRTDHE